MESNGENPAAKLLDLSAVGRSIRALADGSGRLDLSSFAHDSARHGDLVALSAFAWWLLGTSLDPTRLELVLPAPGSSPLRHLARAGVVSAALRRGISLVHLDETDFELNHLYADRRAFESKLPGVDWSVLDEVEGYDRLRIIDDLPDPRRAVPRSNGNQLAYAWLGNLGLASKNISPAGYERLLANADEALVELIDNVHRWSAATDGFAVVSCTRGGGSGTETTASFNRLHILVADVGVGVPMALRLDLEALDAVHRAAHDDTPLGGLSDRALLERLILHAFGDRKLANHNGHGLNAAQVRAGQWVGALDVFTVDSDGSAIRMGSRGLGQPLEGATVPELPGARGTLVHLMLQATDSRATRQLASTAERLPFVELSADGQPLSSPMAEQAV